MKESKAIIWGIWIFTAVVYALVIILHEMPGAEVTPGFVEYLSPLNAGINGTCFVLLLLSLFAVKSGNINTHKKLNTAGIVLSVVFLLSYVTNHYFSGDTTYGGEFNTLFYFVLISHIVLAGLSLPFILLAYYRGYIGAVAKHKKLVRFTYPVWLYVTFTGVLVYLFLAPYY